MLKILWKRGEIALVEQFLLLFTILSYLISDFYIKTRIGFSLRDKRSFEITEVEITRVDCISTKQRKKRENLLLLNRLKIKYVQFNNKKYTIQLVLHVTYIS